MPVITPPDTVAVAVAPPLPSVTVGAVYPLPPFVTVMVDTLKLAVGQVTFVPACAGLVLVVWLLPVPGANSSPPPNCPTIISDVGSVFVPVPAANARLLVRLMVRVVGPD